MAEKEQDLRIQKTQRALAAAMLSLLETSAFSKITVRDLCTEAMVSRSAFYVHFEDKYALLQFCMETLHAKLFSEFTEMPFETRIQGLLRAVQANKKLLKNLIGSELDTELVAMMRRGFQQTVEHHMEGSGKSVDDLPGPPDILTAYYAAGITNLILYWISKPKPEPVEAIAACLAALLAPIEKHAQ